MGQEAEAERARQEAIENDKRVAELQNAQKKVAAWCKAHGFADVLSPKTTLRGNKKHVLHTAVKYEDCEVIKMLLLCGAQKDAKNSKGQTAQQLVEKLKSGKPREMILAALR